MDNGSEAWFDNVHLILVHGSAGHPKHWGQVMRALPETWSVSTATLEGYGPQGFDIDKPYGLKDEIGQVMGVADRTGRPRFLVGHSMGGVASLASHARHPGSLDGLILIEPVLFGLLDPVGNRQSRETVFAFFEHFIGLVGQGMAAEAAKAFFAFWDLSAAWERMNEMQRSAVVSAMPKVARECGLVSEPMLDPSSIREIGVIPSLVLQGARSPGFIREVQGVLLDICPWMETTLIQDAGHAMHQTHANEVARAIHSFVSRTLTGQPPALVRGRPIGGHGG